MPIISDDDIQVHLPVDKLVVEEVPDSITEVKLDAERVIKGRLSGIYTPVTLAGWSTPETTPETIRAIGGRLAAALLFRLRKSESDEDPEQAQVKYLEGTQMLELVATGAITLAEVEEVIDTGGRLSINHFTEMPDPKFTMDSVF
jgi:hypothetical protein